MDFIKMDFIKNGFYKNGFYKKGKINIIFQILFFSNITLKLYVYIFEILFLILNKYYTLSDISFT